MPGEVNKIVFAGDAGMGSSAMGASLLRKKVKAADVNVSVTQSAISNLRDDAQIVITQDELTPRAKTKLPHAYHISVDNFLSSPEYDKLVDSLQNEDTESIDDTVEQTEEETNATTDDSLLREENIFL